MKQSGDYVKMHTRARLRPSRYLTAGAVTALAVGLIGSQAAALPSDASEAEAQLIAADALGLDVLDALQQESGNPSDSGPNYGAIDATVLEGLVGLSLPGIGIPLIGDGENGGLLNLGPQAGAGALNVYAASQAPTTSVAAAGAVGDDGSVDASPEFDPDDIDNAQIDLTALLDQLEVSGLTDQLVNEVSLALGAIAARAEATGVDTYGSEYTLAGAELRVNSPAVGGLAGTLDTTYDTIVGGLETTVNTAVGEGGTIDNALGLLEIPTLDVLGLVTVEIEEVSATAAVTIPDLSDSLLTQAVSDDGLITIDLTTGTIAVDVAKLVKGETGEDLNGLPANTSVLTDETIEAITAGVGNALGNLVDSLNTQIVTGLQDSTLTITLNGEAAATPLLTAPVELTVSGSLAGFAGLDGAPAPVVSSDTNIVIDLGLTEINIPAGDLVEAVGDTILPIVLAGVGPVVDTLLTTQSAAVETTLTGVVDAVLTPLEPVLDGVLRQIVTLTINEQPTEAPINGEGDLGENSFTVRALAIDVLPILGAGAVSVELASASVRAEALAPTVIATPDPVEIGAQLTATGTGFTPETELTVTYVDAGTNTVETSTVTTDEFGAFTDTITVPEGTELGTLTVTGDDGALSASDTTTVIDGGTGTDPTGTDPTGTDPTGTDPTGTDPTGTDPTGTDPTGTDPTGTDPTGTDPTGTDPTGTDPTGTDPTGTDPTGTDPTGTDPTGTDPTGTDPTGTDPTGTDPTGTDPTGTDPTGTDPTGTDPTGTDPTGTDPTGTDPTGTDPTGTDPTGTDPTGTDPTGTDPTGTDPDGYDPVIEVDPGTVEPGDELTTDGSDFPPNSEVTVTYVDSSGETVATSTVTTDDNGDFTDTITVPAGTAMGTLMVTAVTGEYQATDTAEVVSGLGISIDHSTRYRGQVQIGHGSGYAPGTVVHGYMNSTPSINLGTQVANADGEVTFTWTIPASAAIDTHTFSLTADDYVDQSITFQVLATPAAPGPQLPSTGADLGLAAAAGILLLVGGTFAVISSGIKRRRGAQEV